MRHLAKPFTAALTVLALIGTAQALDTPPMREGLWKVHSVDTVPGTPPDVYNFSLCRDHVYDKSAEDAVAKMKECTISPATISGNKRTYTSTCKIPNVTTISGTVTVIWSGDTSFHSVTHTTYTPAFMGKSEQTSIMDESYVGACPAGMKVGDHLDADGKIEHRG